ncbi:sulfurtransferase [Leptospira wolffii]|uniref:sulfurtransferase n=1 Tax=Leptospira wolffii TaxID=409998 RepID=UPI00030BCA4E|nr:sulfurtransferase [Leptospira wolffii]EPG66650.1 putative thiosulfate sulfurtransferase [Leptospira wolffii serovar Khorat str. Khorat-H2]
MKYVKEVNRMKKILLTASAFSLLLIAATSIWAAPEDAVVDTEWLSKNLENPKVRLIEVSVDPGVYEKGHIKGAVNFRWHTDLVDQPKRDIVGKEKFQELASKAGISNDSTIILYGDNNNWFAAWGAWIFNYYGHKDVRILNGGRKKWELEKRPLSSDTPNPSPSSYKVAVENKKLRAKLPDVLKAVESKNKFSILDIRSPDEYSGKIFAPQGIQELSIRAGHIPGAINLPWAKAVNQEDGTFKSVAELKKLYSEAGIDGSKPVIVYCRIGERSSHSWFVLSKLLGYDARQYDGSWTEYGNAVGVPIDNPSGTVWTGK